MQSNAQEKTKYYTQVSVVLDRLLASSLSLGTGQVQLCSCHNSTNKCSESQIKILTKNTQNKDTRARGKEPESGRESERVRQELIKESFQDERP